MSDLRAIREAAGLTQRELAERAGVSRQLVGAVESDRHTPRVDAAISLAEVLGVEVTELFSTGRRPEVADARNGGSPIIGSMVRIGRVADRYVTAPAGLGESGFEAGDALVEATGLRHLTRLEPGPVVLGCEPGLQVLEQMLREKGVGALSVAASTASALEALVAGRSHAAVVHGPEGRLPDPPDGIEVTRFGLAQWRVGLAGSHDSLDGWWGDALDGDGPVIQREAGAGVQRTFENARTADVPAPGPVVGAHVEAARRAVSTGLPAVTIEPAALAVGAVFHPLDVHVAELWVDSRWIGNPGVDRALDAITGQRYLERLEAVGGYDLGSCGVRVA
jgi:DNA-binding XRE family transcriptional regulator